MTTIDSADQSLTINNAGGISLGAQSISSLTVNAALTTAGDITNTTAISVAVLNLKTVTAPSNILLNYDIAGSSLITLTSAANISVAGAVSTPSLVVALNGPATATATFSNASNSVGQITGSGTHGTSINLSDGSTALALGSFAAGQNVTVSAGVITTTADNNGLGIVNLTGSAPSGTATISISNALDASSILITARSGDISATGAISTPTLAVTLNGDSSAVATFTNANNAIGQISGFGTSGTTISLTNSASTLNINTFASGLNLTVNSSGAIATNADNVTALAAVNLSGSAVTIGNVLNASSISLSGDTVVLNADIAVSGSVAITSTQLGGGTGIAINAELNAAGQTVNLTANSYDGANGAYVIIEGNNGSITAQSLLVTLKNCTPNTTSTVSLTQQNNAIATISIVACSGCTASDGLTNNAILNNGTAALAIGSLSNINRFTVQGAGAITTTADNSGLGSVSLTATTAAGTDAIDITNSLCATSVNLMASNTGNIELGSGGNLSAGALSVTTGTGNATVTNSNQGATTLDANTQSGILSITTSGATTLNASAQSGTVNIATDGPTTLTASIGSGMVTINSTGVATVSGASTVGSGTLNVTAQRIVMASNATVSSTLIGSSNGASTISFTADTMSLATGTINAGTNGVVMLQPQTTGRGISIGSNSTANDVLALLPGALGAISAKTLYIGTASDTGGITINGSLDISAQSHEVVLTNAGGYTGPTAGNNVSLGTNSWTALVGAAIDSGSGATSGSTGTISYNGSTVTINGTQSAKNIVIIATASDILLNAALTSSLVDDASNTITISAQGSVNGSGLLTGSSIAITASTGSIGAVGQRIYTQTPTQFSDLNLSTISLQANGDAYVNHSGAVQLGDSNHSNRAGGVYDLIANNNISVIGGVVVAGSISLVTNGASITIGNNTAGATLTANAGAISLIANNGSQAGTVSIGSGSSGGNGTAIQATGNIIIAGESGVSIGTQGSGSVIIQAGSFDPSYTPDGNPVPANKVVTNGSVLMTSYYAGNTGSKFADAKLGTGNLNFGPHVAITAIGGATINGIDGAQTPGNVILGSGHDIKVTDTSANPLTLYAYGGNVLIGAANNIDLGHSSVFGFAKLNDNTSSTTAPTIIGGNVAIISNSPGVDVGQELAKLYQNGALYNEVLVPSSAPTGSTIDNYAQLVGVVYSSPNLNGALGDPSLSNGKLATLDPDNYTTLTGKVYGLIYISSATSDPSSLTLSNAGFGAQQGQHPGILPPAPPPTGGTGTGTGVSGGLPGNTSTPPVITLPGGTSSGTNINTNLAGTNTSSALTAVTNAADNSEPLNGQVEKLSVHGELSSTSKTTQGSAVPTESSEEKSYDTLPPKSMPAIGQQTADQAKKKDSSLFRNTMFVGFNYHNLVLFTQFNQVFSGFTSDDADDDELIITGSPGTVISNDEGSIRLHAGRVLVDTGSKRFILHTTTADISLDAEATAIIDAQPGQPVRVMSLAGTGLHPANIHAAQGNTIGLKPGEELVISDKDLEQDDLIPTDGIERRVVTGGVERHLRRVQKTTFPVNSCLSRHLIIAGIPVSLGGAERRVQKHMSGVVSQSTRPIDYANKEEASKRLVNNSLLANTHGTPAARVLAEAGTEFMLVKQNVISLTKGKVFVNAPENTVVENALGQVNGLKGSCFAVEAQPGILRIQSLTGPGLVSAIAGNRKLALAPGQEVVVSNSKSTDVLPSDGVGRRGLRECTVNNKLDLTFTDFSMISLIKSAPHLQVLRQPACSYDRALQRKLMKCAAVVHQVTAHKGPYSAFVANDR